MDPLLKPGRCLGSGRVPQALTLNISSPKEQNSILPPHLKKLVPAMSILAFILYAVAFTWSLSMN